MTTYRAWAEEILDKVGAVGASKLIEEIGREKDKREQAYRMKWGWEEPEEFQGTPKHNPNPRPIPEFAESDDRELYENSNFLGIPLMTEFQLRKEFLDSYPFWLGFLGEKLLRDERIPE